MDTSRPTEPPRRNPNPRRSGPAPRPASGLDSDGWVQPQAPVRPRPAPRPGHNDAPPFAPPISAVGPLFVRRLERIYSWRVAFNVDINTRPTSHVLGGYYRSRRLVRIYSHDSKDGRRPLSELFDTFLHEVAHHLEYTEPQSFNSKVCRRVRGRMHSRLFWQILGELKFRWAELQARS
ncbi:MAG: hypothetical protein ACYC61_06685 [Isosphaeraceae bacterium]